MDWITLSIEIVGAIIFCLWIIVPIQEFRLIYQRMRKKKRDGPP